MHGNAWQVRPLHGLPDFLFVDRSTSGFDTWRGLTLRSPIWIWEKSVQGNKSYEFSKFPIISQWENGLWRATCWLSEVGSSYEKFRYKGNFFRFVEVGLKTLLWRFRALWLPRAQWPPSSSDMSPHWSSTAVAYPVSTSAADSFLFTPTVWGELGFNLTKV